MVQSEIKTDKKEQEYADAKLRRLQLVQLEMLKVLDEICKRNDIHYQLFAGTALGAVRHRGFIPWDDDLDVVMLREDYEKFLKIAPQQIGNAYFLQKEFSEHWPMQFSKLRKNDTAFIERYIAKDEQTHMGVYLDIFPCDNLSGSQDLAERAIPCLESRHRTIAGSTRLSDRQPIKESRFASVEAQFRQPLSEDHDDEAED